MLTPAPIPAHISGLPDDFNGGKRFWRKKVMSIRGNETMGVTAGADIELVEVTSLRVGFPASRKYFTTITKVGDWSMLSMPSINSGSSAKVAIIGQVYPLQTTHRKGLSIAPSLSLRFMAI